MAKRTTMCSLQLRNEKNVTRSIAGSILHPKGSGLFHFKNIGQLRYAIRLDEKKKITILTEVPKNVQVLLDIQSNEPKGKNNEVKPKIEKTETEVAEVIKEDVEAKVDEEVEAATETKGEVADEDEEDPQDKVVDEEVAGDSSDKPDWYLSYEEVEGMTKKDLIAWSEEVEEVYVQKNRNASETKEIVQSELTRLFPDHGE